MRDPDLIPSVGKYRGVRIHNEQSERRILKIVRPAIDVVLAMTDIKRLAAYAADPRHPPEARLLAAARCENDWKSCADERRIRPLIDLEKIRAAVAGVASQTWRSPSHYASLLDPFSGAAPREARPRPKPTGGRAFKSIGRVMKHAK